MKYFYFDNWSGKKMEFKTLKEAKASASKETGNSITVQGPNHKYHFVQASGYTPA